MAVCMICSASVYIGTPTEEGGAKTTGVASSIVFLMFLFAFFYKPSWGGLLFAVTMSARVQNFSNAIVNQIFPLILNKIGFKSMYMFAGINVLLAGFVWLFIPETKGMALEDMDTLLEALAMLKKE
ncbi:hypothetical protein TWF506_003668 [Arthrobotrys conoides]|uniref:Major facilitator superfamily (MFS) profile domain-containing protein n=1 Tax=Arthrobotrys conoides TaxID=74498 RepID=A0AAN8NGX8_9PEZI